MKQYTRKQLREFVQLGLAVDLTEAEPEKIPASYTKVGFSCGIYGLNGGMIWDNVLGGYYVILAVLLTCFGFFKGVQL